MIKPEYDIFSFTEKNPKRLLVNSKQPVLNYVILHCSDLMVGDFVMLVCKQKQESDFPFV